MFHQGTYFFQQKFLHKKNVSPNIFCHKKKLPNKSFPQYFSKKNFFQLKQERTRPYDATLQSDFKTLVVK